MISIQKGSLLYRLALYGVFFEEYKLSPNGCPFLRRVILGTILVIIYSFLAAALLTCIISVPTVLIHTLFGVGYLDIHHPWFIFGSAIWMVAIVVVLFWFLNQTKMGEGICNKVDDTIDATISTLKKLPFTAILLAMHEKICPKLSFHGDMTDAYLKAFEKED